MIIRAKAKGKWFAIHKDEFPEPRRDWGRNIEIVYWCFIHRLSKIGRVRI
jgi:hypothetical protein